MNLADLGRRAVACKHFYWMPGMLANDGRRVGEWRPGEVCGASEPEPPYDGHSHPDLSDPATIGCLLALVREAYDDARITLEWEHNMQVWSCGVSARDWSWTNHGAGDTEAKALVAALEAAP